VKIFITGATGFFGSCLAGYLLDHTTHTLRLLLRKGRKLNLPSDERVEIALGDLTDPASLKQAVASCEAVIHAAAHVASWARDPGIFDRVNVQGTQELLRAAGEAGAKKIIYISSFLALGHSQGKPLSEADFSVRRSHFNDYERTKYLANLKAMELAEQGLPVVILYPTVMYGPGPLTAGNLIVNLIIDYMSGRLPFLLGDGSPCWNYVYVEDVVQGTLLALEKARGGERYILGGENISMACFFDTLEEVTGVKKPRFAIPFPLASIAGAAEEALAWLTGRMPQTTRAVVEIFKKNWIYDSSLAREKLGFQPVSLREGLERTVKWIRSEGLVP